MVWATHTKFWYFTLKEKVNLFRRKINIIKLATTLIKLFQATEIASILNIIDFDRLQ